ncbi:sel1 repeat family protein [Halosquirtibacter xylanolyticus]|uniref:tetratricopeptide repeat protein n=1 Tax=Halosquirtibacter xylanolyticus TaxID=3374599 RepID=UPI003748A9D4|nr:sel1 repeat family protein [Prolixibacteraceae bacterium]
MKIRIIYIFLLLCCGLKLSAKKNHLDSMIHKAQSGDLNAQIELTRWYYYGNQTVLRNTHKAFFWCLEAAKQGDSNSQFLLSMLYYKGNGINKNITKSFQWCEKAALNNHAEAMFYLGRMYLDGIGTDKDSKKALYYIERAYNYGNEDAMIFWQKNKLWEYEKSSQIQ